MFILFSLNLTFVNFISDYSYVDSKTFSGVFQNIHDSFEELSSAHCFDKNAQFSPGELNVPFSFTSILAYTQVYNSHIDFKICYIQS